MDQNLGMLNSYLFDQMERLNDEEMTDDELKKEVIRSQAMTNVAGKVIDNASLALKAAEFSSEQFGNETEMPKLLGAENV
ncbi:hypothetical protein LIX87_08110 [Weissella viridescens]|uniref:hypothetical protein n=1 Tax=Weissella viridescens TaxID=1629 RepID=UPI001D08B912|nr:hypothetical protein [Weissella viridescens]MCB6840954.1 hypothetical protein [Weissella viridescens]MCB6847688.1 hypothetical protein [Weissella viridescens]